VISSAIGKDKQIFRVLTRPELDEEVGILGLHGLDPFPIVVEDALMACFEMLGRHAVVVFCCRGAMADGHATRSLLAWKLRTVRVYFAAAE
jgi:hypothetical protein